MRLILIGLVLATFVNIARAQSPAPREVKQEASVTTATPELWLYEQERQRYEDPKTAVRRKAEFRTAQRLGRIEAMKWFGMSNSRPVVYHTPTVGPYAPSWVGNGFDAGAWRVASPLPVVVR